MSSPMVCIDASPIRPLRRRGPLALGRRASFWVSAGVVAHTLWTSAAPAMTYRLYAAEWHLTHTVTTGIFAVYPIVVVAVLIGFGDISDHIGRRTTMLLGLCASLIGALLFAAAPSVPWLFAGCALMGVGVGLSIGPSTAAMVEFSPEGQAKRAASITTAAQAFGFAAALLLGGTLTQYAPWPIHLSFWVLSALYLFAYLSLGVVALALGVVATQRGLGPAVNIGAAVITLLSLATIGLLAVRGSRWRTT